MAYTPLLVTMKHFEEYVLEIEEFATAALLGNNDFLDTVDITKYLNGDVGTELRRRVPLDYRQNIGAFFTGEALRKRAIPPYSGEVDKCLAWDPACGAGDLLLGFGEQLPVFPDLGYTMDYWGKRLCGNDIEDIFLRAAKARLVLSAYSRGSRKLIESPLNLSNIFPEFCRGDSLTAPPCLAATEIILNPPFISINSPSDCKWASGQVSAAAAFIDRCIRVAQPGTRITAILPDVLRTGSRYGRWRNIVNEYAEVSRIDVYGTFDPQADVDVFILELKVRNAQQYLGTATGPWGVSPTPSGTTLGDYCSISVGPVVPHRHAEIGTEYPYLHAKDAMPWGTIEHLEARRRFSGTTFTPPFVAIRRTSSPSDKFRAIGTLISSSEPVAVENHLIICSPHDRSISTCEAIIKTLQSRTTNEWLNSRIRCRHLTVGAVKEIPWKLES